MDNHQQYKNYKNRKGTHYPIRKIAISNQSIRMSQIEPKTPPKVSIHKVELTTPSPQRRKAPTLSTSSLGFNDHGSLSAQTSPYLRKDDRPLSTSVGPSSPNLFRSGSFQPESGLKSGQHSRTMSFASKKTIDLGSNKILTEINDSAIKRKKELDDDCKRYEIELTGMKKPSKGMGVVYLI